MTYGVCQREISHARLLRICRQRRSTVYEGNPSDDEFNFRIHVVGIYFLHKNLILTLDELVPSTLICVQ
jgi:hypothetical protein